MAAKKAKESSALKERLAAKRKKRQTEIQTEKGVTEGEAATQAAVEMKAEEVKEMTKLQETLEVHPYTQHTHIYIHIHIIHIHTLIPTNLPPT